MIFSNIQNLLENGFDEAMNYDFNSIEPISEAHITPDAEGLGQIVLESTRWDIRFEEALAETDQQLLVCESAGFNEAKLEQLQEAVIGNVFKKIVDGFKELYAKIVGFFKKLMASLSVMSGDVKKSLSNAEKYLNKNFSEYTYTGYKWKSTDIAQKLSSNLSKSVTMTKALISSNITAANGASLDKIKAMGAQEDKPEERISKIVGSNVNTLEEAKRIIIDSYLESETPEIIKGFAVENKDAMLTFLKGFEKNKVLNNLKDNTIKEYQKVVQLAEKTKNDVEKIQSKYKSEGKDPDVADNSSTVLSKIVANAKTQLMICKSNLNIYNTLMGECITLEKKKFNDYKKAISGAVRYTPKKDK